MREIDIESWDRKPYYEFFSRMEGVNPIGVITAEIDVTEAKAACSARGISFFLAYMFCSQNAINEIVNFRYRFHPEKEGSIVECSEVFGSTTVARPDHSFGFACLDYHRDFASFAAIARERLDASAADTRFPYGGSADTNLFYVTVLTRLSFTSLVFNPVGPADVPRLGFGKARLREGRLMMPIAIQYHHGFVDGYHVSLLVEYIEQGLQRFALEDS